MQSLTSVRLLLANGEKLLPSQLCSPGTAALPSAGSPSHPKEAKERGRASGLAVGSIPAPPAPRTWVFLPGQVERSLEVAAASRECKEGPGTLLRASLCRGIPYNGCRLKLGLQLCTPITETNPTPQDKMGGPRRCPPATQQCLSRVWLEPVGPSLLRKPWGQLGATEGTTVRRRGGGCVPACSMA